MATYKSCNAFNPPRRQSFSFPDKMMNYIFKNVKPMVYYKLVQTCKLIFVTERMIMMYGTHLMHYIEKNSSATLNHGLLVLDDQNALMLRDVKLWVSQEIVWDAAKVTFPISRFIKHVYRFNLDTLVLKEQQLSYAEYSFLLASKTITTLSLLKTNVYHVVEDEKEEAATIEELIELIPGLTRFSYHPIDAASSSFNPGEMNSLPYFSMLSSFKLYNVNETFDYHTFCDFTRDYRKAKFIVDLEGCSSTYQEAFKSTILRRFPGWEETDWRGEWSVANITLIIGQPVVTAVRFSTGWC